MKSSQKVILSLLVALLMAWALPAQNSIIRGTILDEKGEPVVGANVVIVSQGTGATTNGDGIFSIAKPESLLLGSVSIEPFKRAPSSSDKRGEVIFPRTYPVRCTVTCSAPNKLPNTSPST